MVVTASVGPRIIHFSLKDGENLLKVYDDQLGLLGDDHWNIYGGHRLWHAPEDEKRSYQPDNDPLDVTQSGGVVRFVQDVEAETGIQKAIEIDMAANGASAVVRHHLTNKNLWDVTLAPWGLTVMAPGGKAVLPLPPRGRHPEDLLPANSLTLWAYTDMDDPRWTWGTRYIMLQQEEGDVPPQKVGAKVPDGWLAYVLNDVMFVKQFAYDPAGVYPDMGCNAEMFTNHEMLEIESLGQLITLLPDETVVHEERWSLYKDVPAPDDDNDVAENILPKLPEM
jgi:hypothetical protein